MPIILGGGIGGLSAAHYLLKNNNNLLKSIKLLESSNRFGGWIKSTDQGDFIFESGPRTIRPSGIPGMNTLNLLEELQLEEKIRPIVSSSPAAQNRMIYAKNQLCSLPSKPLHAFQTLSPFSKPLIYSLLHDIQKGRSAELLNDESIYDFTNRRFGSEVADYLISSMVCGICAGDSKEISVKFLMSDIFKNEQKYGGVLKGILFNTFLKKNKSRMKSKLLDRVKSERWSIYSLDGGLETLPNRIVNELKDSKRVEMNLNTKCNSLEFQNDKVILHMNNYITIDSDYIISAIPSYKLSELVYNQHPDLSNLLNSIPFVDVALVNVQYKSSKLITKPGFGFLVPPCENLPVLGVIYDSCCFDMEDNTILTVMMGGKWFDTHFGIHPSDEELLNTAQQYLKQILNINQEPDSYKVNVHRKCIAQYTVGHHDRVNLIEKYINDNNLQLGLVGSSYYGVGVNDVILSSKNLVEKVYG